MKSLVQDEVADRCRRLASALRGTPLSAYAIGLPAFVKSRGLPLPYSWGTIEMHDGQLVAMDHEGQVLATEAGAPRGPRRGSANANAKLPMWQFRCPPALRERVERYAREHYQNTDRTGNTSACIRGLLERALEDEGA